MDTFWALVLPVLVALVGVGGMYIQGRDQRADALKEAELIQKIRALDLAGNQEYLATEALTRRLRSWDSRARSTLLGQGIRISSVGLAVWLLLKAVVVGSPSMDVTIKFVLEWVSITGYLGGVVGCIVAIVGLFPRSKKGAQPSALNSRGNPSEDAAPAAVTTAGVDESPKDATVHCVENPEG